MHVSEVPKFLAESPSETTHTIELVDPFDATHSLIIPLQLSRVTNYFDVYSPSVTEYENDDIPKIHLTVKEPPRDHQQVSIQKEKLECSIIKVRSVSLPQQQGDQYLSALLSHTGL